MSLPNRMTRSRSTAIMISAVALSLVLTGCVGKEVVSMPTNTPPPITNEPADQIGAASTELPNRVFEGDCDAVLSSADIMNVFGASFAPFTPAITPLINDASFATSIGGVSCVWSAEKKVDYPVLSVQALPIGVVDEQGRGTLCEGELAGTGEPNDVVQRCDFAIDANGIYYSGAFTLAVGQSADTAKRIVSDLQKVLKRNAEGLEPFSPSPAPDSQWKDIDCAYLAQNVDVAKELGLSPLSATTARRPQRGSESVAVNNFSKRAAHFTSCVWSDDSDNAAASISVLSPGGWASREFAALSSAKSIDVEGADSAFDIADESDSSTTLAVFVGSNWVVVRDAQQPGQVSALTKIAAKTIALLDRSEQQGE